MIEAGGGLAGREYRALPASARPAGAEGGRARGGRASGRPGPRVAGRGAPRDGAALTGRSRPPPARPAACPDESARLSSRRRERAAPWQVGRRRVGASSAPGSALGYRDPARPADPRPAVAAAQGPAAPNPMCPHLDTWNQRGVKGPNRSTPHRPFPAGLASQRGGTCSVMVEASYERARERSYSFLAAGQFLVNERFGRSPDRDSAVSGTRAFFLFPRPRRLDARAAGPRGSRSSCAWIRCASSRSTRAG